MAYNIMQAHNTSGDAENLKIKFDAMASHDITFVGIIQTARASGLEKSQLRALPRQCRFAPALPCYGKAVFICYYSMKRRKEKALFMNPYCAFAAASCCFSFCSLRNTTK